MLGIDPSDPQVRSGGLQDNGSVRTKPGGLSDWNSVHGGDGLQCEVDPIDSKRIYMHLSPAAIESAVRLLEEPSPVSRFGDMPETGRGAIRK